MAGRCERLDQVGPYEAATPRDEDPHAGVLPAGESDAGI